MDKVFEEIRDVKKSLGDNVCILGHHYQQDSVASHCDIMGDSLELAQKIKDIDAKYIVFCGVYFMGETAALLAKDFQKVYLPEPDANCMMSLMASARMARNVLNKLNSSGRKIIPLAYVNTMLELKDVIGEYGGAVCTSANAAKMLNWALEQGDGVLFLPDRQLGENTANLLGIPESDRYVLKLDGKGLREGQENELDKKLLLWPGGCAVHSKFRNKHISELKQKYPNSWLIAHPECRPEIINICNGSGSTSFIIREMERLAKENFNLPVFIGTEENLVFRLAKKYASNLDIHPLGKALCPHMSRVTPYKLLTTLLQIKDNTASEIKIPSSIKKNAQASINRMLSVMDSGN